MKKFQFFVDLDKYSKHDKRFININLHFKGLLTCLIQSCPLLCLVFH